MSDAELLTRYVRDGDRGALADIIRRYEKLVWSVCRRALNNRADVEDAFQVTFMTLTANASRIRKRKSLSNWLFGVARTTSLNIRKQRAVALLDDALGCASQVADKTDSTLHAIRKQNEIDLVDQQLNAMPTRYRTPLILKYFSGMTAQQIADQMNLSTSAVEGRLRRGRAQLRIALCRKGLSSQEREFSGTVRETNCFGLAAIGFVSQPNLIATTVSNCISASAGSFAGLTTGTLTTGAKLMICKTICATALVVLTGAFLLHSGANGYSTDSVVLSSLSPTNHFDEDATTVAITSNVDSCECCDCCDADCCPGASLLETVHTHLAAAHTAFGASLHQLADWVHGTEE